MKQESAIARRTPLPSESVWGGTLVVVVLVTLIALLLWSFHADRSALLDTVEQERLEQLDTVVLLVTEDVDDVLDDLRFVVRIASTGSDLTRRAALEAILAGIPAYRAATVWSDGDTRSLHVVDPRSPPPAELSAAMDTVADRLESGSDSVQVSSVVEVEGATYRVFGYRSPDTQRAMLAVDTTAWLSGLRLVSSDPSNRLLVLGPGGRLAPATDERVEAELLRPEPAAELLGLMAQMRSGGRGTMRLSESTGMSLGLGDAQVVVAYAPIRLADAEFWSVATLTSAASLADQEAALVRRFVRAMAAIILLFAVFGAHFSFTQRRTALLRERLEHAAQLADVNAQLLHAEKLATVGGISAGIAHEIGTPLGVIRGRAEYTLRKIGDEHPQAPSLVTIIEQIDRVSKIIRGLLDYSQPHPASGEATRLADVVDNTVRLLAIEFERADVAIDVDIDANLPDLQADPDQLQQVLVNLLVNARDACEAGATVRILSRRMEHRVCIEVTDNGPGIPESYVNQIFDPFFTTKKRGHGTGLGLAVVSQIVRSHGGEVEIESTEGVGTTIRMFWPGVP